MISLPNNCNCSELTINPKNWKTCKVSAMARNWYIQYYFYDQALERRKFVRVKNMNHFKTLSERREATAKLIENELYQCSAGCTNGVTRSSKYLCHTILRVAESTTNFFIELGFDSLLIYFCKNNWALFWSSGKSKVTKYHSRPIKTIIAWPVFHLPASQLLYSCHLRRQHRTEWGNLFRQNAGTTESFIL